MMEESNHFNKIKNIFIILALLYVILNGLTYTDGYSYNVYNTTREKSNIIGLILDSNTRYLIHPSSFSQTDFLSLCDTLDWGVDEIDAEKVFGGFEDAVGVDGDYTDNSLDCRDF